MDRDEVSDGMFGVPYSQLSAWGKRQVVSAWQKFNRVDVPYTTTLHADDDPATLTRENERLARDLESAKMENLDLWDENTELKAQLIELQAQFNPQRNST